MRKLIGVASVAALAACATVGSDYERPKGALANLASANASLIGAKNPAFVPDEVPADWWRLYRDPVLDRLIADALAANTDLRVAAANIERAHAGLDVANSARDPSTNIAGAESYSKRSAEEELKGNQPLDPNLVYGVSVGVSYQVDLFGRTVGE